MRSPACRHLTNFLVDQDAILVRSIINLLLLMYTILLGERERIGKNIFIELSFSICAYIQVIEENNQVKYNKEEYSP